MERQEPLIDTDFYSRDYTPESSIAFTWTTLFLDLLIILSDSQTNRHGLFNAIIFKKSFNMLY